MGTLAALRLIRLAVVCVVACPASHAQLPRFPERCSPGSSGAENWDGKIPGQVIIIDDVEFDGPIHLSEAAREKLVAQLKQHRRLADSKWIEEIEEVARGAWQDEGYFKAKARAKAQVLYADGEAQHVSLTIAVDEGLQYRLSDIQIREVSPESYVALLPKVGEARSPDPTARDPESFPQDQLRKLIPLRDGEIFDTGKIREGLDALRKLYASKGYIDFTAEPLTDIDDARQLISLVIELDEQKQFRIGKVEILGLNQMTETVLRSKVKSGDVFNDRILEDFYKENKSPLPADASLADDQIIRNVKEGTVDLIFDFRTCPTPD
jgi:outer membrane protein assembly factor BamA